MGCDSGVYSLLWLWLWPEKGPGASSSTRRSGSATFS